MIDFVIDLVSVFIFVDIGIVMFCILMLALGGEVQHIPFWDGQIRLVVSLFNLI